MSAPFLILTTMMLSIMRLGVPTVGHSWPMVVTAAAHIFVGAMLTVLWQRRGRWMLGWVCLGIPTTLEAVMFFLGNR